MEHLKNTLDYVPLSIKTICLKTLNSDPDQRPDCNEVLNYPELKEPLCKYFETLEPTERNIVYEQISDIVVDTDAIS